MRYIRTPTGEVFRYEDCEDFENEDNQLCQSELRDLLFQQYGMVLGICDNTEE